MLSFAGSPSQTQLESRRAFARTQFDRDAFCHETSRGFASRGGSQSLPQCLLTPVCIDGREFFFLSDQLTKRASFPWI